MEDITNRPNTLQQYSAAILVEFERRVSSAPGTFVSTYFRYTNWPRAIVFNGTPNFYTPLAGAAFTFSSFQQGPIITNLEGQQATEIVFDDHQDIFKGLGLVYDFLDWKARVWEVGVNTETNNVTWLKLKINGRTEGLDWNVEGENNTCTVPIGPDIMSSDIQGPLEEYTPTCRFRFKSDRCGYFGPETVCNRTETRCIELGNQRRFGGFPRAPKPNQQISASGRIIIFPSREQYFPHAR